MTINATALINFIDGTEPVVFVQDVPVPAPDVIADEVEEAWVYYGGSQNQYTSVLRCPRVNCRCGNGRRFDDDDGCFCCR